MARIADPVTRRFVREATIGLIVVAGLLVIIIVGLARRFGAWQRSPQASDIQAAQVYKRARGTQPDEADVPQIAARPGGKTPPPVSRDLLPAPTIPEATAPVPAATAGHQDQLPEPRSMMPGPKPQASTPQHPVQAPRTGPADDSGSSAQLNPQPTETIPAPFRAAQAQPASQPGTLKPSAEQRNPRDDIRPPDPKWTIRIDDTLWTFCDRNYGDPQWFRAFHAWLAEQGLVFEDLGPGRILQPPSKSELQRRYPKLVPRKRQAARESAPEHLASQDRLYSTSGQESLFDISARMLGQAARYVELIELNRDHLPNDVDYLEPLPKGLRLQLPPR